MFAGATVSQRSLYMSYTHTHTHTYTSDDHNEVAYSSPSIQWWYSNIQQHTVKYCCVAQGLHCVCRVISCFCLNLPYSDCRWIASILCYTISVGWAGCFLPTLRSFYTTSIQNSDWSAKSPQENQPRNLLMLLRPSLIWYLIQYSECFY